MTPAQGAASALSPALLVRIVVPFGLGYFVSYLFRVVNAVIAGEMSAELGLDANALGLLTSIYFATFAAFQLPLGVLLDRFGPRRVESALLLLAAAGAVLFATATGLSGLIVGRALIGLGVSACLMAAFIAFRRWFDPARLPLVNGMQMAFGGLGALAGTRPAAMVLEAGNWRILFLILAVLTVVVAAIIWSLTPRDEARPKSGDEPRTDSVSAARATQGGGFRDIFKDRFFWRVAPMVVFSQAAFLSIQSLWIGTWLRDVAGMPIVQASNVMAMTTVAMVGGFLGLGWLTSWLARRGIGSITSATFFMVLFLVPQAVLIAGGFSMPMTAWIGFGFLGTAGILGYAVISQHFPVRISGRANTAVNFMVFLMAFAEQWGLGVIINQFPAATGYDPSGYSIAMGLVFVLQVVAIGWYLVSGRRRVD